MIYKKNYTPLFIFILIILSILSGYNYIFTPFLPKADRDLWSNSESLETAEMIARESFLAQSNLENPGHDQKRIQEKTEEILSQLSTAQRIYQLISVPINLNDSGWSDIEFNTISDFNFDSRKSTSSAIIDQYAKFGFVTIFGSEINFQLASSVISELKNNQEFPVFVGVDHEGGSVQRLSARGFTKLPSWSVMCQSLSDQEFENLLDRSALELKEAGIDIVWAPVLDVADTHPVLKDRVCGDNHEYVAKKALQFIDIFHRHQVRTSLKHFPGLGKTTKDTHISFDSVALKYEDTLSFRKTLDYSLQENSQQAVMVGHVGIANQDAHTPCSLSASCIDELIQAYPQVLVVSDALEMSSARYLPSTTKLKNLDQVALEAISAGNHVLLFGDKVTYKQLENIHKSILEKYTQDAVFAQKIDEAVTKVIQYKLNK